MKSSSQTTLSVQLEFKNISYSVKTSSSSFAKCSKKSETVQILYNLSGKIEPGDFVAVMGGSGAGKSTLLNILSRRIISNTGSVYINDVLADQSPILKGSCSFVQQDDLFYGHLTVEEHLKHQAALRLAVPKAKRDKRVQQLLNQFSLNKVCNSRIGNTSRGGKRGISGGEKKRLSVATELLINPALIFADEPTSGLDTFMAEAVVDVLKYLSTLGHTVITTIHQPSSDTFSMFNKVLLLAEGRMMYFGPRIGAIPYFLRLGHACPTYSDPAEFFIEVLALAGVSYEEKIVQLEKWMNHWTQHSEQFLTEWKTELHEKFKHYLSNSETTMNDGTSIASPKQLCMSSSPTHEEVIKPPMASDGRPVRVNNLTIFKTLFKRNILSSSRNDAILRARFIQTIFISILGGFVYFRLDDSAYYSRAGAAFFIVLNQTFMLIFSTLTTLMNDKEIVLRERDAGLYHLSLFFMSVISSDLIFQIYIPILYLTISWFLMGLNDTIWRFLFAMLHLIIIGLVVTGLAYVIGSGVKSMGVALAITPIVLLPTLMIAGFMIQKPSLSKFWLGIHYISPFTYGFSSIMRCIFLDMKFTLPDGTVLLGNTVLEEFSIDTSYTRWFIDLGTLIGWAVLSRVMALLLLLLVYRKKKT